MKGRPGEQRDNDSGRSALQDLESKKYRFRTLEGAIDTENLGVIYEWFEDSIIKGLATLDVRILNGIESATIKQTDPSTGEKVTSYYTTDKEEVARLKLIRDKRVPIIIEGSTEKES